MSNRKAKSNRAQADFFELIVCKYICSLYSIPFRHTLELNRLKVKIPQKPDGESRLTLQIDNLEKIKPTIKKILDEEIKQKGKIVNVKWVGRNLSDLSTSDIDTEHSHKKQTRFSIKSIASSGTGTLKNIGMRQIEEFLKIDFSNEYEEMWDNLKLKLKDSDATQKEVKRRVLENDDLYEYATQKGKEYQIDLNQRCVKEFNSLTLEEKIKFLNYISDNEDPDLYVIIVNSIDVVVYKPIDKNSGLVKSVEAREEKKSSVGFVIYVNGKPAYRVQTNCTNGIGISAFCQRIFLV